MAKTASKSTSKSSSSSAKSPAQVGAKGRVRSVADFLWNPTNIPDAAVIVVAGGDDFLKHEAIVHLRRTLLHSDAGDTDAEFSGVSLDVNTTTFPLLRKELATGAMFSARRIVFLEDADAFVTKYRSELEEYVDQPAATNVLVLTVSTFPQNTNLAKKVAAQGLILDASPLTERAIIDWVGRWAQSRHRVACPRDAAELLVTFIGTELGLLDQELAKLALSVREGEGITAALVEECVGSWRVRKAFDVIDLALDGKTAEAVRQLDLLLRAGEQPQGVLAQISATMRRLSAATWIVINTERSGRKVTVSAALTQAGVPPYFVPKAEQQLKRLGRHRGAQLATILLKADLDLKGGSRLPPRIILERLLAHLGDAQRR